MPRSLFALLAFALAACAPTRTSAPTAGSAAKPAASSAVPAPRATDWSKVQASDVGNSILAYKTLARHADAWYRALQPAITLAFNPDGHAEDGQGRRLRFSAADWKGVIREARRTDRPTIAFASPSDNYSRNEGSATPQDKFGTVPRYKYRLDAPDDDHLRMTIVEKMDGGIPITGP